MEWTMDAIVDATKLWSLDAYASIPLCRYDNDVYQQKPSYGHTYIPCKISTLYTNHSSNNGVTKPPVSRIASPEEILVALEAIPDHACDDLLKAYIILCRDNGRLFRSLLGLPMGLRKKWLMIEIKAYQNIYSTCTSTTNDLHHD
uniref:Uncharacterized protein n=2 Tax=Oryza sativa subsp. japonica TaxID=39947 RepID=Q2R9W1_ORYSJ|nr:hypothetical protein LOC_Os11g07390 [Oryza sativa Japonica Group]ABA91752.1 hypothetical protein LOC_Os11g07390 [Oryza sativa Japonica Group]